MVNDPKECTRCLVVPSYPTFLSCCFRDAEHFPAERRMGWYVLAAAAIIGALAHVAYWALLVDVPGFAPRAGWTFPYLVASVVAVGGTVWHLKAVRRDLGEMVSMMVGMTFGMIGGFLAGYLVGATNGMFTGSVVGVLTGCALGWYIGDCCGMMSRMEGLMAGLMGGIMGGMTAVMLLNDRIRWFTPFLLLISFLILSGLTYLVHKEHREKQGVAVIFNGGARFPSFLAACFLAMVLLVLVIQFGPTSALFVGL